MHAKCAKSAKVALDLALVTNRIDAVGSAIASIHQSMFPFLSTVSSELTDC